MGAGWGEEPGCCDINIFSFSANTGINNDWNENKKFRVDAKKTKDIIAVKLFILMSAEKLAM